MPINHRRFTQTFIIALLVATADTASAQLGPSDYGRLKNVEKFAFGGIGYAGITSEGETDFRILMQEDNLHAIEQLEKLYAEGSPQAKAYALEGLHLLDSKRFNELNAALPKMTVNTVRGCIAGTESLTSVAKEIASGKFDQSVKYPTPPATLPHPQSPPSPPPPTPPHPTT